MKLELNSTLKTEPTVQLFNWWKTFHPNLPMRSQFAIDEHWSIASNIYLIEVLEDTSFRYKINGEEVIELVGQNQANTIFDIKGTQPELVNLALHYQAIINENSAMQCYGTLSLFGDRLHDFESVDCPLVDSEGKITHIIGALARIGIDEPPPLKPQS